jgi:hypothetical protein
MSRTDFLAASDAARAAQPLRDGAPATHPDFAPAGLAMLPALHHEAGRDLYLWGRFASTPQFCIALMLEGAVVLAWGAQAGLGGKFTWAAAVVLGVAALTRNHIRGFTCSPRQIAVTHTVRELRLVLLYLGLAWSLGPFLVLPQSSAATLVLLFVAAPGLAAAATLKDAMGRMAFVMPAALLTAGAVSRSEPSHPWVVGALLLAGVSIAGLSMLQRANRRRTRIVH